MQRKNLETAAAKEISFIIFPADINFPKPIDGSSSLIFAVYIFIAIFLSLF